VPTGKVSQPLQQPGTLCRTTDTQHDRDNSICIAHSAKQHQQHKQQH
jgi:hypothetical protein